MILDTKWKIPDSDEDKKQGIAQSDLYQMFAYACKFKIYDIKLVYPLCDRTMKLKEKFENPLVFNASKHFWFEFENPLVFNIRKHFQFKFFKNNIKVQVLFAPLPF